jgi:aspartyl-tRNA(Asn)/glutamyl-tRNA(Gln) amidotransferase subunit A
MTNKFTDPIHYLDATALAQLIRTGQLSSREVVQAHLDHISAVNPKINAVVTLTAENALEAADAADKAVSSGAKLGPLHGVPFTVKDSIHTANVPTQRGSPIFKGRVPDTDATSVSRMKEAGGILLAKTNLPEFSYSIDTAGVLTQRGSPIFKGRMPDAGATSVARMKKAGGIAGLLKHRRQDPQKYLKEGECADRCLSSYQSVFETTTSSAVKPTSSVSSSQKQGVYYAVCTY